LERVSGGELAVPATPILIRSVNLFEKLDRVRGGER
jgi:hypothetical protein